MIHVSDCKGLVHGLGHTYGGVQCYTISFGAKRRTPRLPAPHRTAFVIHVPCLIAIYVASSISGELSSARNSLMVIV